MKIPEGWSGLSNRPLRFDKGSFFVYFASLRFKEERKNEPRRREGCKGFVSLPDRGPVFALRASPRQVPIR
jgi:hypothetical protein